MSKPSRRQLNQKRIDILDFASLHSLVIDPAKGFENQIKNYFIFGYCPCDPTMLRKYCPCPESLEDIAKTGHCLCRLYWESLETFKRIYKEQDEEGATEKGNASS